MKEGRKEGRKEWRNARINLNWFGLIGTKELTWMKWMTGHEWVEKNDLNELTYMKWHEWIAQSGLRPALFLILCDWLPGDFFCWQMKSSSCYSLVHLLSTSSSKSGPRLSVFTNCVWNRAPARVSCTLVDLIIQKWSEPLNFFCNSYVKSHSRYCLLHLLSISSS